jgi:dCTP deaminase
MSVVLPDWRIKALCEGGMIEPFDPTLLNPASLDVTLGTNLFVETEGHGLLPKDISEHTRSNPYLLMPNEFVLAETIEVFNIPDFISAQFVLKSSLARAGLEHLLAGFIDPGFHDSVLTLEFKNAKQFSPFPLWPGMRCGQIVFTEMTEPPQASYRVTGRYNHDAKVSRSKGLL